MIEILTQGVRSSIHSGRRSCNGMSRKPTDDIQEVIESIYKQSILFVNCFAGELAGNRKGSNSLNAKVAVI